MDMARDYPRVVYSPITHASPIQNSGELRPESIVWLYSLGLTEKVLPPSPFELISFYERIEATNVSLDEGNCEFRKPSCLHVLIIAYASSFI